MFVAAAAAEGPSRAQQHPICKGKGSSEHEFVYPLHLGVKGASYILGGSTGCLVMLDIGLPVALASHVTPPLIDIDILGPASSTL